MSWQMEKLRKVAYILKLDSELSVSPLEEEIPNTCSIAFMIISIYI
jgi:hypothetical protein